MAAGQPPHLLQLVLVELVQGGQRPGQLHRLGLGQRPQLPERQRLPGPAGQSEPVPAGDQQPAPPRIGRPGGQQPRQRLIPHLIPRLPAGAQVVLEVVQQHQHRHPAQDVAAEEGQPVLPAQVRPGRGIQRPDHDRAAGVLVPDQQLAAEGGDHRAEQAFQGQRPGQADQDPGGGAVQDPGGDLGGQGGLAAPADPADHDPGQGVPGQVGGPAALLPPPPDEIPVLPPGQPRDPRPRRPRRHGGGLPRGQHRHRPGTGQDGDRRPFPQPRDQGFAPPWRGLQPGLDLAARLGQGGDDVGVPRAG